ncbi:hypothetical protein [Nodularia sp. UHCC 0506]|uniref:hypothetical protein n=1 Tax=Nodularia sp. UHCC 0506 TaxID=3110243 RepID=UPI002B1F7A99|nr:hypothetical protein [Nodularia sp. UHCC 0506]MEA5515199.1 hypothetical protein [Nodularia sp. UHCC 0506]
MRLWNSLLNSFFLVSQYNPHGFVELLMLMIASVMIIIATILPADMPYLVLGLSLGVGASISILVREAIAPSSQTRVTQFATLLLLFMSIYGFAML